MKPVLALLAILACVCGTTGCGDDAPERSEGRGANDAAAPAGADAEAGAAAEAGGAEAGAATRGPLVKLRDSQLGPVLFSGSDRALYLFTRDRQKLSRCHGECAVAWPPFFAKGRPRAGRGVKRSLLGTIRRGGRRQVTYAGQPLYFYVDDPKGQVLCNDIVEFGGTWFALTAKGRPPAA